jgi:dynein heavy chain 1
MDGPLAVAANGNVNGNGVSSSLSSGIDPQVLVDHLSRLLQVTLGATQDELLHPDSLLALARAEETLQRCSRFAQEAHAASMYIQKLRLGASREDDTSEGHGMLFVFLDLVKG